MENIKIKKDQHIETVRGLALLMMVAGHVIGVPDTGMKVADDSIARYLYFSLMYIRMPLYTVISGYVYSLRPVQSNTTWKEFALNKFRRLFVPLVFVSTIQYLFQTFIPSVNTPRDLSEIWKIYLFSYSHFWYLQALLLVFAIIIVVDYYKLFERMETWLIVMIITSILFLFPIPTKFFSLQQFSYLMPFFLLGYGLAKFRKNILQNRAVFISALCMFLTLFILQQLTWFFNLPINNGRISLLSLLVGITSTTVLIMIRFENRWLAIIGKYSYTVYLWHVFGTAGSRIILNHLMPGHDNYLLTFLVGLVTGAVAPIFFEMLIVKSKYVSFLCLGTKLKR